MYHRVNIIQIGYTKTFVIYLCTHCTYSLFNTFLYKKEDEKKKKSRDPCVSTVPRLWGGNRSVVIRFRAWARGFFCFLLRPDRHWVPTGPIFMCTETPSFYARRPLRKADHSPPFSVKTKNVWSCISTLTYSFFGLYLYMHEVK